MISVEMENVSDLNLRSYIGITNSCVTILIRETDRCAAHHSHGNVCAGGERRFGESGRQCSRFLDSQSQTGEELAKVDRRHAAIADRNDIGPASSGHLSENVLGVVIGIVKRTEDLVGVVIVQRTK